MTLFRVALHPSGRTTVVDAALVTDAAAAAHDQLGPAKFALVERIEHRLNDVASPGPGSWPRWAYGPIEVRFDEPPEQRPAVHFIGFRGNEYRSAVRVWGLPDVIHRGWDLRAAREIGAHDILIFANGVDPATPHERSFDDSNQEADPAARERVTMTRAERQVAFG